MTSRSEAVEAWAQMAPLRSAGYDLIPLVERRTPFKGWRAEDYSSFDFLAHLGRGGGAGVRLGPEDLVIDIDPRNGGEDSFDNLCLNVGVNLEADHVPAVRSGGGGTHLYYRKPLGRTRVNLPADYPGIDFKREGGYVVAPGSMHPSGRRYAWLRPLGTAPQAPQALLDVLGTAGAGVSSAHEAKAAGIVIGDPAPIAYLDELHVPDRTKALIAVPAAPGQRSERVRSVILSMIASGESNERILGVLLDPDLAISESLLDHDDPNGAARRQIVRAHAWLSAQRDGEFDDE